MKLRNGILACLLAALTVLSGPASLVARAQFNQTGAETSDGAAGDVRSFVKGFPERPPEEGHAYLVKMANGGAACRDASPAERLEILKRDPKVRTSPYRTASDPFNTNASAEDGTGSKETGSNLIPGHLDIVLRPTAQLQANPEALAAFERAAATWESLITSEITVVVDVDFGTTRFGKAFGENVLGSTSGGIFYIPSYSNVRSRLVQSASNGAESALYGTLPPAASGVPTDSGLKTQMDVASPIARALGAIAAHANPNDTTGNDKLGSAPSIGFNSTFNFDFDPTNGITAGRIDFDAVAVHELGHLLGFDSEVGILDVDPSWTLRPTIWDLFRFRPGTTAGSFSTAQRVLTTGGEQRYFDGTPELALSTGNPEGSGGDEEQASHWKDDRLAGGVYIGIMDPTIGSSVRRQMTDNDRRAIDFMGYRTGSAVQPPQAPANDNFASAVIIQGASGTVLGTNVGAGKEAGEPSAVSGETEGGRSVWYAWVATGTGQATFDTLGSDYDTTLAVFTGSTLNALSRVAQNDDIDTQAGNVASRVQLNVTAGTVYRIMVDGYDGESGGVQLNWSAPNALPPPTPYSVTGRVVDPDGSTLVNVSVALEGPALTNGTAPAPTFTNSDGFFQFTLLSGGGNYTVRPNDPRYTFSPATATFNNIGANQSGLVFVATAPATVTGTVTENGAPLAGVSVGILGFGPLRLLKQTTTDANGRWTFNGMTVGQAYNVIFVESGYTFNPPSLIFPLNTASTDMGSVQATRTNDIERSDFFVTQHYRDFLGREPDQSGLNFWVNDIESCGVDLQCREVKRVNVSAAFFLSIEFQQTGYLVERMYKAAYGDFTETSTGFVVPVIRREEFAQDTPLISAGVIVNVGNWEQVLEANKVAYAQTFVGRQRFLDAFPASMTPAQFVDKLNANAGSVLTADERNTLVNVLTTVNNTAEGRASVLRKVAENAELDRREKNRAFVLMQYFGYLRRNPNSTPDTNYVGYNFWLSKLNEFNGDFVKAEMVKAFLDSTEYRSRFGTP